MSHDIDHVIARIAPGPGPGMTSGARELLEEIKATPVSEFAPARSRRFRWRLAAPLVAVVAAVTLAVSLVLPEMFGLGSYPAAAAALDIKREGDNYIVTVKDLFADPGHYQAQFRSLGLDVTLEVRPVTPSMEGVFLQSQGGKPSRVIKAIEEPGDCFFQARTCTIGFKIPVGYRGKARIDLGRKARPGESYSSLAPIDAPGEPLYCVEYALKSVDQVRLILKERGVTKVSFATNKGQDDSAPGSWFVHEGVMSTSDRALLLVGPTKNRPDAPGPIMGNGFCAKGH
jgi:hypothetical protein